jgi:chromosome segregation and condensation protein ScpB
MNDHINDIIIKKQNPKTYFVSKKFNKIFNLESINISEIINSYNI